MLYLTKFYLPQMEPGEVQKVTHGAKGGFGTYWCRTILTSAVGVTQTV